MLRGPRVKQEEQEQGLRVPRVLLFNVGVAGRGGPGDGRGRRAVVGGLAGEGQAEESEGQEEGQGRGPEDAAG